MKKLIIFLSIAAVMASACTKVVSSSVEKGNKITFQTVAGLNTKAITGTAFPTTETFSTYAWAEGTVGEYFMDNVTIEYNATEDQWMPFGETFYWPKNTTVDFISYYPTGLNGITVEKDKITYSGIDVYTLQNDIMYADKAAGFSDNQDLVDNSVNGFTGVPTIFRHALAKVKFIVELNYNHKEEADGTVTDWEVTVNSASISGIYTTGEAVFNLSSTPTVGVIPWEKPAGNVWTPDGTVATINGLSNTAITPGTDYTAVDEVYVLPQALAAAQQKVTINLTIKTIRNGAAFLNETFDKVADLYIGTLPAWEINHVYTYRVKLSPTASNGNGGQPIDPSDPSGGVDPNNPDLSDAIISFDPAVDGWENVGVEAIINL
jgi:hypothetical protein